MPTIAEFLSAAIKDKPLDGSDCKTLEAARLELGRLRRVALRICEVLEKVEFTQQNAAATAPVSQTKKISAVAAKKKKKKRQALKVDDDFKSYVKVVEPKSESDRKLLKSAMKKKKK